MKKASSHKVQQNTGYQSYEMPVFRKLHTGYLLLGFLLWMLLTGCDMEKDRQDKYKASINPENGKIVEVNGEKFRIIYIGGVRFRFPDTDQFRWVGGQYASSPLTDGIDMSLYRLEVQPGKVPGTKSYRWFYGDIEKPDPISVQIRGTIEPVEIDSTKEPSLPRHMSPTIYIGHDDVNLGLKVFSHKDSPKIPSYAYPLTPLEHPVYIPDISAMYINYAPKVKAEVDLKNMGNLSIDPNWKEIYFEVVNTLNQYREDKQ